MTDDAATPPPTRDTLTGPHPRSAESEAAEDPVPADPAGGTSVARSALGSRRAGRRAVRPGAGDPDPSIDRRALDDRDVGWQPAEDSNDDRLRRDVPPHW